ncbi:universal stress protein [Streptomyces sp. NPDC054796]
MSEHPVVVGVDGSPGSVRALDRAVLEAGRRGAPLRIVFAVRDAEEADPVLAAAAARARVRGEDVSAVAVRAAVGDPVTALAHESRTAALVVVGGHDDPGPVRRLFGSLAARLAVRTRAPLVVVRGDPARHPAGPGAVVLADTGVRDADAAAYALTEAARSRLGVRVLPLETEEEAGARSPERGSPDRGRAAAVTPLTASPTERGSAPGTGPVAPGARGAHDTGAASAHTVPHTVVPCTTAAARRWALVAATKGADTAVIAGPRGRRLSRSSGTGPGRKALGALLRFSHCPVTVVPVTGTSAADGTAGRARA